MKKKITKIYQKLISFLKESKSELLKVVWPSKKEVIRKTVLVIVSIAISTAIIGGFDLLLIKLVQLIAVR
jgi:preprotein translocase subunit SecE